MLTMDNQTSFAASDSLSDAARFNVEDARTSYDSVVNNAEDVGTPIRISKSDQGTRQTCDDIHILSKGKTVQGADTDDGTPLDREKSVHVLTPDMLTETPKRDEYPKSKRQNITGTVSSNDLHVRHHLLGPGLTTQEGRKNVERGNPTMVYFPSHPTAEEWANITAASKSGIALTGSAAMGKVGPVIGLMDVGECEDAYLFRLALPGVKRDESEFNCGIDHSGKVSIHGITTTGEKSVNKFSQVFQMTSQNLCPPGHFSLSFQLPGRVIAEEFSGNFGTDGILEGIVKKEKPSKP